MSTLWSFIDRNYAIFLVLFALWLCYSIALVPGPKAPVLSLELERLEREVKILNLKEKRDRLIRKGRR